MSVQKPDVTILNPSAANVASGENVSDFIPKPGFIIPDICEKIMTADSYTARI